MRNLLKTLAYFYHFEAKRKLWFGVFLVTVFVYATLANLNPYFYKLFVDDIPNQNSASLIQILVVFVGIKLISLVVSALSFIVGDIVSFDAGVDARTSIFKHIQDLDFAFHSSKCTGSLISVMKRGDGAFYSLHHAIHYRIIEVVVGFAVMAYFFSQLDGVIFVYSTVSFIVALLVMRFVIGLNVKTRRQFNEAEDEISGIIVDNIINFESVKLFAKEVWEQDRLKNAFDGWKRHLWKYANSFRAIDLSVGGIINISIFLILYFALGRIANNQLTLGEFVLVLGFVNSFYPQLFELVYGFRDIAKNYADIEKYFKILDFEVEIQDPEKPIDPATVAGEIVFENVSFSYGSGKRNALKNVSLTIRQGQSVALVGRSGSGKTTMIKLLMRFYDPTSGAITLDGFNIKQFTKTRLRSHMGIVPQEPVLFNNTIGYNIAYGKDRATKKEIVAAAKMANLHRFIESLPDKYQTHVGERGIKLSGGQKQRLAIARMILSEPRIIVFDEATSQLDSENESLIQSALWKTTAGKTTIVIAHRLSTAMRADKIIVMEKGKIVETGSHKMLYNKTHSLYRYFWDLQSATL